MSTIANPAALLDLKARLASLRPASARRWGTLTSHEMLCHLGDATEMALRTRPRANRVSPRRRPVLKWLLLWTPIRWPRGWRTNPHQDPRVDGTKPSQFEQDLQRLLAALDALAAPNGRALEPAHGLFGMMDAADWQRWAWKHTDHHLRQFGL